MKDEWEIRHELYNLDKESGDPFTEGWIEALTWAIGKTEDQVRKKYSECFSLGSEKGSGWRTALLWILWETEIEEGDEE